MDISSVCRTCLSKVSLTPISFNSDGEINFICAIFNIAGVKITQNDGLPQNMCTECIDLINKSHNFRIRCLEVQNQLLALKSTPKIRVTGKKLKINKVTSGEKSKLARDRSPLDTPPGIKTYEFAKLNDEQEIPIKLFIEEIKDINNEFEIVDNLSDEQLITVDDLTTEEMTKDEEVDMNYDEEAYNEIDCQPDDDESFIFNPVDEAMKDVKTEPLDPLFYLHPSDSKTQRVTCKLCLKDLSIRSIEAHMARSHPGADERKRKCEFCDKFLTAAKMDKHVRTVHQHDRMLKCGYCKLEFDKKEELVQHVTTCTAKKKRRKVYESGKELTECDVCHKTMQRASLKMHTAVKHAGLGPVCEHCGRRFGNKFRLNEHYRAKHGYDKFKCTYCDFESASVMALRNHERKHRGEKPFACETCDAKFHAAYLLAQHRQSHRTEKLVKCDLCPASFKANNSLHMHKLSCHSRVSYKCSICGRAYSCRHYGVKHARLVHRHFGSPPLVKVENVGG